MVFNILPEWLLALNIPIFGADVGDSDVDDVDVEDEDEDEGDEDVVDSAVDDDDDDDDEDEDEDNGIARLKAKYDREKARRKAAEADLGAAQDLIDEALKSSSDEANDEISTKYKELAEAHQAAVELIEEMSVERAIQSGKRQWEDVETVLALLDLDEVEVDIATGEIDGLDEQLEDLAKSKPFLLKKAVKERKPPAGDAPDGGRRGDRNKKKSAKEWAENNPAYSVLMR